MTTFLKFHYAPFSFEYSPQYNGDSSKEILQLPSSLRQYASLITFFLLAAPVKETLHLEKDDLEIKEDHKGENEKRHEAENKKHHEAENEDIGKCLTKVCANAQISLTKSKI